MPNQTPLYKLNQGLSIFVFAPVEPLYEVEISAQRIREVMFVTNADRNDARSTRPPKTSVGSSELVNYHFAPHCVGCQEDHENVTIGNLLFDPFAPMLAWENVPVTNDHVLALKGCLDAVYQMFLRTRRPSMAIANK